MVQPVTVQHPSPVELLTGTAPLPYTINPWALFVSDLALFARNIWSLPFIVWPIRPCNSGHLDELSGTFANVFAITVHVILLLLQLAFLISIVPCLFLPVAFGVVILYIAGFVTVNKFICDILLNGRNPTLQSKADISHITESHGDERWIFLNGVAVGQHWLQSNIDRISMTFGRRVMGVHNPTVGIVFDVIECLIQRDFGYVTQDVRNGYAVLKAAIRDPAAKKVIFIIHSQGGIEGGLILDWLFAEVSAELMEKLEVYTFGNAANHFNNPISAMDSDSEAEQSSGGVSQVPSSYRSIKHVEHYSNDGDFVSRWGVLHFASSGNEKGRTNRYAGRVFERHGKGHQFNQHYLDTMFPLDTSSTEQGASETNLFMDSLVRVAVLPEQTDAQTKATLVTANPAPVSEQKVTVRNLTFSATSTSSSLLSSTTQEETNKVSHYSRLWQYRNGKSPAD